MFSKTFLRDLAERAVATYIQSAIGFVIAAGVFDADAIQAAAVAAIPAGLSVVKSALARRFGNRESASADPRV